MTKIGKTALLVLILFSFVYPVFAADAPDMVEIDVSGTGIQQYLLSATEVTQQLYQEVTGRNPSSCVQENESFSKMLAGEEQSRRPVETVTFFDAMWFCNLLTEDILGKDQCVYTLSDPVYDSAGHIIRFGGVQADFSKKGYRLPTREEWQNAAGAYPASGAMYAWEVDNSGARGEGRSGYGTHAVGKKMPDASGLYDISGNVAEMCHEGESLNLCIMGTAWNKTDEYYPDGYTVDFLHGYSQYTISRYSVRECFGGYSTCGFRLCQSVSDMPFTITDISVPDICDTYEGIVPVFVTGSGFLSRRTEPLVVSVQGFASQVAGSVEWLSDSEAVIPVRAAALRIEGSQKATLRVVIETSYARAEKEGSVTRVHTEFPVHPADVILDDGSVVTYEENHVFSSYEIEHAAAIILYAPYDGTEILALGLAGYDFASAVESLDEYLENYSQRASVFGTYLGSGWYIPSAQDLMPLSDESLCTKINGVMTALGGVPADMLLTTDSLSVEGLFVPVKQIDTRGLITQKYEFLSVNNMLKEAAQQEAVLAQKLAEKEAEEAAARAEAERAATEAERVAAEAAAAEQAAAEQATAEQFALEQAAAEQAALENAVAEEETEKERSSNLTSQKGRTLIGFGIDTLKVTEPSQRIYAELSAKLFVPFLYLAAEGSVVAEGTELSTVIPGLGWSVSRIPGLAFSSWDAAVSLGFLSRLNLGAFQPGFFISGGAMINQQLWETGPFVRVRLEAGTDIPLLKWLSLTARYSGDFRPTTTGVVGTDYSLTAGISFTF